VWTTGALWTDAVPPSVRCGQLAAFELPPAEDDDEDEEVELSLDDDDDDEEDDVEELSLAEDEPFDDAVSDEEAALRLSVR
jgi:hypothetical protein